MQIITPIEITDDILTSPIAEPDISQGEVEWFDKSIPEYYSDIPNYGGYITSTLAENGNVFFAGSDIGVIKPNGDTEFIMSSVRSFFCSAAYGGYVYLAGAGGNFKKMDSTSFSISDLTISSSGAIRVAIAASNGFIYFASDSDIVILNPVDDSTEIVSVAIDNVMSVIEGADGKLYFSNRGYSNNSELYSFDTELKTIEKIADLTGDFSGSVMGNDGNFYFAGRAGYIGMYNTTTLTPSRFGSINGWVYSLENSIGSGIFAVGQDAAENGRISIIDTLSQSVSDIYLDTTRGYGITQIKNRGDKYVFCFRSTSVGSIEAPYDVGNLVISADTHKTYSATADNYDDPVAGVDLTPPTWVEVSATNKYKMFDYSINTASSSVGDIQLLPAQTTTTLSMYGMSNVASVNIIVKENSSSGAEIYNVTKDLTLPTPVDDMIANEALYRSKVMFSDLPVFANPWINIVINRADTVENWSIGDIAIGNARTMGVVVYQSSTSRTSYDSVETDDFGNETIISRPSAEYTTFELSLQPIYADYVERILKDSLNKPRVYIGDKGNNEKLFTFGYYERSPITYVSPSLCETTLKVRGLV